LHDLQRTNGDLHDSAGADAFSTLPAIFNAWIDAIAAFRGTEFALEIYEAHIPMRLASSNMICAFMPSLLTYQRFHADP
jgi:hypothetical protein